ATRSERVARRLSAISFRPFQNASSRLTLVLWPAMTMERLTTGDFIARLRFRSGAGQVSAGLCRPEPAPWFDPLWSGRTPAGWRQPFARPAAVWLACAWCED